MSEAKVKLECKEVVEEKPETVEDAPAPRGMLEIEYDQPSLAQIFFVVEKFLGNKLTRYKSFLKKYLKTRQISLQLYNRNLHAARLKNEEWLRFVRSKFAPKEIRVEEVEKK